MNTHVALVIILLIVIVLGETVLWLLKPWFTYDRGFLVCALAFFLASTILFIAVWRLRAKPPLDGLSKRVRLLQALLCLCAGITTLVFRGWLAYG